MTFRENKNVLKTLSTENLLKALELSIYEKHKGYQSACRQELFKRLQVGDIVNFLIYDSECCAIKMSGVIDEFRGRAAHIENANHWITWSDVLWRCDKLDIYDKNVTKNEKLLHTNKTILDACCGSRMFWFDRENKNTVFMDNRTLKTTLCDGRKLTIEPDVIGDFRNMPFAADTFKLVVFDPPHLVHAGEKSWLAQKYGRLCPETWKDDLRAGFTECFRVLQPGAFLIFKWNENQIKIGDVVKLSPIAPLFGQRHGETHWLVFMKPESAR